MNEKRTATLLIVDDIPENIDVLRGILKQDYKIKVASNGEKALKIAQSDSAPDLILLDIMMPGMDGYEVCRQLKANFSTANIPVIFVTAKGETADESLGFDIGAVDYITKPVSPPLVLRRVRTHLSLYDEKRLLDEMVKERTNELDQTRLQIIQRLGRAAEYKDNETGMHVIRMSHYSKLLGLANGMSEDEAELLLNAAPMHDIGKIGIPDRILLKPGKLDADEWEIMKTHSQMGADIIGTHSSVLLTLARNIALTHHERWDGTGYPNGLKGEEISIPARIVAIADTFDALTTIRPYKHAWSVQDAINLLQQEAGTHFDPDLVEKFLSIMPQVIEIKDEYAEITVEHLG
ncbi:MAG: two-component system response regulator [Gammaproteobacteria bacterium]|nr:MAG: two-component system response regulator [Gammaproteobacteria bacterium]